MMTINEASKERQKNQGNLSAQYLLSPQQYSGRSRFAFTTACFAANHTAQSLLTPSPRRIRLERWRSWRPMLQTLSWGVCSQWHFLLRTVKLRTQLFLWALMPY